MKLSFSIAPKCSSVSIPKPKALQVEDPIPVEVEKEYLSQFDLENPTPGPNRKTLIISEKARLPYKRTKDVQSPIKPQSDSRDPGAVDSGATAPDKKLTYGLNLRDKSSSDGDDGDGKSAPQIPDNFVLKKKPKQDLRELRDQDLQEFNDMPVEEFAVAHLAEHGWKEGMGIGKGKKHDFEPKEFERRPFRHGLGFVEDDTENGKDKRKTRDKDGFEVGKTVRVINGGKHIVGFKGVIKEVLNHEWVVLEVAKGGEDVEVHVSAIAGLGSMQEKMYLKKLNSTQNKQEKQVHQSRSSKHISDQKTKAPEKVKKDVKLKKHEWLKRHIRVRIISKDLEGGSLYLKEATVVDVVEPHACHVRMDESGELLQTVVDQDLLQTALPHRGGCVLVLYGKHKGLSGKLVKKDVDQNVGVVQSSEPNRLLNVKLDQIAEYVGDSPCIYSY